MKRSTALQYESLSNCVLAKRKMTGTWIHHNIDTTRRKSRTGTGADPSVFANFEPDFDARYVKQNIAEWVFGAVDLNVPIDRIGPSFEPAGFVVDPIAGKMLFAHESSDRPVHQ